MKFKVFIVLLILIFSAKVNAQNDYIQYYQLVTKVNQHAEKKKYDSLNVYLKQAFNLVDYVHIENLKLGKRIAKKNKDSELLAFCKEKLKKSNVDINQPLKEKLDSICNEDQRIRGNKYYNAKIYYQKCLFDSSFIITEKKRLESKKLMEEWWRVDSSNIEFVKNFNSKYGFPSEKLVEYETNRKISIVLAHYDKDTSNHILGKGLEIALMEGKIKPNDYAWIIDRHLMNAGKKQNFYTIPTPWIKMTNEQKIEYNKKRESIGLKSLEDQKVIVRKNSVTVKY